MLVWVVMREMNLPQLLVSDSLEMALGLYRARSRSNNALAIPTAASIQLIAYMAWPNDSGRRNSWIATLSAHQQTDSGEFSINFIPSIELFGELRAIIDPALDLLTDELSEIAKGWSPVADVLSRMVDMTDDERIDLRGGPSLSKALDISNYESEGLSVSQARRYWRKSHDVAHLIAAAVFLASNGIDKRSQSPIVAAWAAPDAVTSIAAGFEEFGLKTIPHGQGDSILPKETVWRVPIHCRPNPAFLIKRRLSNNLVEFLTNKRRSPKPYQGK